jgi:hypothetical protein
MWRDFQSHSIKESEFLHVLPRTIANAVVSVRCKTRGDGHHTPSFLFSNGSLGGPPRQEYERVQKALFSCQDERDCVPFPEINKDCVGDWMP